jgi:single-strand DNA-binding protein
VSNVGFKGNIGKVRGLQFGNDGKPRFSFSVAEGHSRFNKQTNEWEDTGTTWWNVTAFGKQAETLADVIQEGQKQRVTVVGRAQT